MRVMPATFAFARSAARTSRFEPAGTLIVSIARGAMELMRVAPAACDCGPVIVRFEGPGQL